MFSQPWFARELQPILGYARWGNFLVAINRAVDSCRTQNINVDDHFLWLRLHSLRGFYYLCPRSNLKFNGYVQTLSGNSCSCTIYGFLWQTFSFYG